MYGEEDIVKEDVNGIIQRSGFSPDEFKVTVETGTSYNPSQIVGTQVWITIIGVLNANRRNFVRRSNIIGF